ITEELVEKFCQMEKLPSDQSRYFLLLCHYDLAKNADQKSIFFEKILEHLGAHKKIHALDHLQDFLRNPLYTKLQVLLSFHDIPRTPSYLASLLNEDPMEITRLLLHLEAWGLAVNKTTHWEAQEDSYRVQANFHNEALRTYHNASLQEAMAAQDLDASLRRYRSLLLPLSAEDFTQLLVDIEGLIAKAISKFDSASLQQKHLYKLNLNLFPVTSFVHQTENGTRLEGIQENL
ncbi:MAG: TIGR02147 family protein, partial [Bdellovibrio sp.]